MPLSTGGFTPIAERYIWCTSCYIWRKPEGLFSLNEKKLEVRSPKSYSIFPPLQKLWELLRITWFLREIKSHEDLLCSKEHGLLFACLSQDQFYKYTGLIYHGSRVYRTSDYSERQLKSIQAAGVQLPQNQSLIM